ncbi:hypothetical protein F4775DRAFT_591582 [Biscogniauxia sp. FL1348]|nr:hypothetical protein F4775DRAFT_591582 [Biscogniauxia sp. FL1348]
MVGKIWSDREEKYFWRTAVGYSPKRAGIDRAKPEKSWDMLAKDMQRAMGDNARREYTGTMLFEHYFQNIESQRKSPHAVVYVYEYLKKLGPHRQPPDMAKRAQYLNGTSGTPARRGRGRPPKRDNSPSTPVATTSSASTTAPIEMGPNGPVTTPLPDFNAPMPAVPQGPNRLIEPGVFSTAIDSTTDVQREEEEEEEESLFVKPYDNEELEEKLEEGEIDDLEEGEIRE